MIYEVADLVERIKVALDINKDSTPLIEAEDIDTLTTNEVIESKIEQAARSVIVAAPNYLLDSGVAMSPSVMWHSQQGYGSGYVYLPNDFLRLVCFQMSDWSYPVRDAITSDNPLYVQQFSRFPGIKGHPQKPVVAIVPQAVGQVLEFFSCLGGETVTIKQASYMPIPTIVDGSITLPEKLVSAIVYHAASIAAQTFGDTNLSTTLMEESKSLMV